MSLDQYLDVGGTTRVRATMPTEPPTSSEDAYPRVARDQRDVFGQPFTGADEVYRFWAEFLATRKRVPQSLFRDEQGRHVLPRIEYDHSACVSTWVAVCPECSGGMALWDRNPNTACLDCGRVFEVDWQQPAERAEACRLLAARPKQYRVWLETETLDDLRVQNATLEKLVGPAPRIVIPDEISTDDVVLDAIARRG